MQPGWSTIRRRTCAQGEAFRYECGILYSDIISWGASMHITNLRKVGGSVMMVVPPAILDMLHLQAGATVGLVVDGSRLIVESRPRHRYSLEELLAQCDPAAGLTQEDREWLDAKPVGSELL